VKRFEMSERDPADTYAEQQERQAEFEELVREDDDFVEAVEDTAAGKQPEVDPEESPTSSM
jgi:hypothetical protein